MEKIMEYFKEISKIPRCSGNEKAVSDYLVGFAKQNHLEVIQDEVFNIIIKKPATSGYENAPPVILQGHLDMVCNKKKGKIHDFSKDPITLRYMGDMIYGDDTTLGADNGIAIAYIMAIVTASDLKHPSLEILLTVSEESDMIGANFVNPENFLAKRLINLDAEEEGKLLVSCAGGVKTSIALKVDWEKPPEKCQAIVIAIKGLQGGHSGIDIDKGRGNSIKLLGRVLYAASKEIDLQIVQISGGFKTSTIPIDAEATILVPISQYQALYKIIEQWDEMLKNELIITDTGVRLSIVRSEKYYDRVLSLKDTKKALRVLITTPNGVQTIDKHRNGVVQSSSNLGVVTTNEYAIIFDILIRSSLDSLRDYIKEQVQAIAELLGADFHAYAEIPAWRDNPNSRILAICQEVYQEMTGKGAVIEATHGSVECALFGKKIKDLNMISFGPDLYDVHTANEHLSISSMKRTYDYLIKVLEALH